MTMADRMEAMESCTTVYKPATRANLSHLKATVTALEPAHPFRSVVRNMPDEMPAGEYAAIRRRSSSPRGCSPAKERIPPAKEALAE